MKQHSKLETFLQLSHTDITLRYFLNKVGQIDSFNTIHLTTNSPSKTHHLDTTTGMTQWLGKYVKQLTYDLWMFPW